MKDKVCFITRMKVEALFVPKYLSVPLLINMIFAYFSGLYMAYHQTSNINRTLVGNKIVDHSDEVGTSPFGAAPITSSFST